MFHHPVVRKAASDYSVFLTIQTILNEAIQNSNYALKNKITQNLPDAKTTTPSHVCRRLRLPLRAPSTASWGLRLGEL